MKIPEECAIHLFLASRQHNCLPQYLILFLYLFSQVGNRSSILRLTIHKVGNRSPKGFHTTVAYLLLAKIVGNTLHTFTHLCCFR
ncbi:MAG: hypothetical protein LBU34_11610 [Planctomycetaceae bacterium]|nr:hypothetical protein [Planctomycetaceae bacterium]